MIATLAPFTGRWNNLQEMWLKVIRDTRALSYEEAKLTEMDQIDESRQTEKEGLQIAMVGLQEKIDEMDQIDESRKTEKEGLQLAIAGRQKTLNDGILWGLAEQTASENRAEFAEKKLALMELQHKIEMNENEQTYKFAMNEIQETSKKALAFEWERDTRAVSQFTRGNSCKRPRAEIHANEPVHAVPWSCAGCEIRKSAI